MTAAHTHSSLHTLTFGALFHQYKLLERIGVGGQGVVWSGLDQGLNQIYAIKFSETPDTDEAEADSIRDEHQLDELVKLRHAHILPLHEYGFDKGLRFTVSPYIPGGTLSEKIKTTPLSSDEILQYAAEIASALDYLHSQEIIHRDLKTSNILLDLSQKVYLADFGLARMVTTSTLAFHTGHGTPPYAPPEQVQMQAITPRSDIFSFGILLYEMFTGQLPWSGKKQLGLEQTHSKQEIPDPREFNENLPEQLVNVLRLVTSADSQLRPESAGEAMKMLYYIFETTPKDLSDSAIHDELSVAKNDIEFLLSYGLERWHSTTGTYNLGLTKFALVDLARTKINSKIFNRFLLSQALTYGYNDDHWWAVVDNPRERLAVTTGLLLKRNETITARLIGYLTHDEEIRLFPREMLEDMTTSLLEIGTTSDNVILRQQVFDGVRTLSEPGKGWNGSSLNTNQMERLGVQALEDSEVGDTAAKLVGHLRSASAVQVIIDHLDEERIYATLLLILQTAGTLPSFVDGRVRFRLTLEWTVQRLIQQPANLIGAYFITFLGTALGVGIQNYLTYNLTDFFDSIRIISSIERGLIVGSVFGFGIFLTRVIIERLQTSSIFLRVAAGTIAGGLTLNIALLILHILILQTSPMGWLITLGCVLISFTIAISSLLGSRLIKMLFSSASIFIAVIGTWWIHINYATSNLELTPLFKYDYSWSLMQVSLTVLIVALMIGIFGSLVNITIKDE